MICGLAFIGTNHLAKAQTITATIPVGGEPIGVAITPNGEYAYIPNYSSSSVSVINTATNTVTATITGFNSPYSVAITPNGEYAYVTNDVGTVSVMGMSNAITSPSPTSTVSPTEPSSPSPSIPEFSTPSLILVAACVLAVTTYAATSAHKKLTQKLNLIPSRRQHRRTNQK